MDNYFEDKQFGSDAPVIAQGEYESCRFTSCDFQESTLTGSIFSNCLFEHCNMSNARVGGVSIQESIFINCKLMGLRFDSCNSFGFSVRFEKCLLDHSSFFDMNLRNCFFTGCRLMYADFSGADISGISMTACDLGNAIFERTNMQGTDLRNSFNFSISPEDNQIKGARFSSDQVLRLLDKYQVRID